MQSQFLQAAYAVLQKTGKPMSPKDIVERAIGEGFLSDTRAGRTPRCTLNSKLSVHILKMGEKSLFVRTAPGLFDIRRFGQDVYTVPPRPPRPFKEQVLVFPSDWLDSHERFQGLKRTWEPIVKTLFASAKCSYLDRIEAEQSEQWKQVLTYVMVSRKGQLLAFKRGTYSRVEDFLRGCQCIGFGGHVASSDLNILDAHNMGVMNCAARELDEELRLPEDDILRLQNGEGLQIVGILNDDSSLTGRRHFAVIMRYETSDSPKWDTIKAKEHSVTQLRWLRPTAPSFSLWDFEYWSQLCLREFYSEAISVQPSYRICGRGSFKRPQLLCVLGQVGSGKSEATRILRDEFGYEEINTGQVLAKIMGLPPVTEETRAVFQEAAWKFIASSDGPRLLAEAIWAEVPSKRANFILIDGIRQRATLDELKRLAGYRQVRLLYIHTPPDVAYQFYRQRGASVSIYDFLKVRDAAVEEEIAGMLNVCDAVLYNWTGRIEFRDVIRKLMAEAV